MSIGLDAIQRGRQEQPPRVLLYSPPKIGKTGWAAQIPGVVFIASEQGTQEYDVARVPMIGKCDGKGVKHSCGWSQFHSWLDFFATQEHPYKAIAIDTLDWLESVLFTHLIATCPKGRPTIVECHGGYSKAYDIAVDEWRRVAVKLDRINARGIMIAVLAHSQTGKFYDPQADSFDQHRLKMHAKGAGFWQEWADAIIFANFELVKNAEDGEWTSTGRRVCYTSPATDFAFIAGNRYGLPEKLDLNYNAFAQALASTTPKTLLDELEVILKAIPDEFEIGGEKKQKQNIRTAFKNALDRRLMVAVVNSARAIAKQLSSTK